MHKPSTRVSSAAQLKELLAGTGETVSTAESCTGGNIAHLITSISGSSEYFIGSVVSYAVRIKEQLLQVSPSTVNDNGIVSAAVASSMAEGVKDLLGTTYSVATTGWADTYGDEHEPAGTVWIAVSGPKGTKTLRYQSKGTRKENIQRFSKAALNLLVNYIRK